MARSAGDRSRGASLQSITAVCLLRSPPLQRQAGFRRYHDPGNLIAPEADGSVASFLPGSDRFALDFATEDKRQRELAAQRKVQELNKKREEVRGEGSNAACCERVGRWAVCDWMSSHSLCPLLCSPFSSIPQDVAREQARWARMDAEAAAEQERLDWLQADGRKARKNQSGVPFDPVTSAYKDTPEGQEQM